MSEYLAAASSPLATILPTGRGAALCLAAVDWTAVGLWAAATLVAATMLGSAMNRRRQALSQSLKDHVLKTIGPPAAQTEDKEDGDETAA